MIIGNGLVATAFLKYRDNQDVLIFASGVSNSKTATEQEYRREENLLKQVMGDHPSKTIVYFGSCSVCDQDLMHSRYVAHKLAMEQLVTQSKSFYIFRLSNLVGRTSNAFTITNFLFNKIKHKQHFKLWMGTERNLIDVDDASRICSLIIDKKVSLNQVVTVANTQSYRVETIVKAFERLLKIPARYAVEKRKNFQPIDVSAINWAIQESHISFDNDYLSRLLQKYYT